MTGNRWISKNFSTSEVNKLIQRYNFTRPIALALACRDIQADNVEAFFNASLSDLGSPYELPGTEQASKRLWDAIKRDEHILIHGDFDVDGLTSSALLSWVLSESGANVSVFVPARLDTGYGFTPDSLDNALKVYKCNLLITVDCGITSVEAVDRANELGIDVIITDHHEQAAKLPSAHTIINSKLHPELKKFHCLAGVGTAFKLAHAFIKYSFDNQLSFKKIDLKEVLDLVALGTVADIVPILGENRILTKNGLKALSKQIRPGIRALCDITGVSGDLKSYDIAFKLAPYINAAGRLGDPGVAYNILNTHSIVDAMRLVQQLKEFNTQRRAKENEIFKEAESQIYQTIKMKEASSILIYGNNWHQGVIGNVASRIARDYNRPTIVLTVMGDQAYGSGRSCANLNLVKVLSGCSDILTRYGGHPMAVGLSLLPKDVEELKARFEKAVSLALTSEDLIPQIEYDGEAFICELNEVFFEELEKFEPFGFGNPPPIFRLNGLTVPHIRTVGQGHSKGYIKDRYDNSMKFIAFNFNEKNLPPEPWDVLATPQLNFYNGMMNQQLNIVDVKTAFSGNS
ncbi:MAG TPA: single-stranded-DNA-specific exonuclease RecJ [Lentisphaeria bacterium]|nr:MAG: single-stranded-DNA-specific exonuclease RecJ [Lentisphaerae bacterium GWF2_38_69]HBM15174.1 single-stranded-DNA-specific exonuclease RecJ [Lentisphaeria bacterium]